MKQSKQYINWAKRIKERDKVCQICKGSGRLQAHHIIPRGYKLTRHEELNGILLCYPHHKGPYKSAHQNAVWFNKWLNENKPEVYKYILNLCRNL